MNIEVVDQIQAALIGVPPKLVGLRWDGAFGLVKAHAVAGKLNEWTLSLPKPLLLSDVIDRARLVVAGDARAITDPAGQLDLAVSLLAVSAQLGRMSMMLEQAQASLAKLDAELEPPAASEEDAMRKAMEEERPN